MSETNLRPAGRTLKIRSSDVLLAVLMGALILLAHDLSERVLMLGIAILQLIEGRVPGLNAAWGRIGSLFVQLVLGFLLIGITGGVDSHYYLVLLLPVVSTATYLGVAATVVSSVIAIGTYLSFLLFINWSEWEFGSESAHILAIRCLLPAVVAVLVNSLGQTIRSETARLAEVNQHLIEAEAAVRRAERLAALGQLTAGLAHELRNPLSSIKGSAELLARGTNNSAMTQELAGIVSSEVDRTNLLVTRFLDFARPLEPIRETVSITEIIDRAASHAHVSIERRFSPKLPELAVDPALMEQVFINLIANASEASTSGTPVTVEAQRSGGCVDISVKDRGEGIPADRIESIFNPFFTTKQTGVGLGLAIVAKVVDEHGGKITVESQPGSGTTFRVSLPIKK